MTREDKVAQFNTAAENKKFSEGGYHEQFIKCFLEESSELNEAVIAYVWKPTDENRANLVKEWADVQVVLSNLAWFFDIDGEVAFNRVHNNNMSKLVDGKIVRREDGKVLKPEGYVKPDMSGL